MDYSMMTTPALVIDDQVPPRRPGAQAPLTPRQPICRPPSKGTTHDHQIFGLGCANCHRLEANAKDALATLGLEATIEKVTDFGDIASYGVMKTPGLVVDENVLVSGRVPDAAEIARLLAPVA